MQKHSAGGDTEITNESCAGCVSSPFLQLADLRARRKLRIILPPTPPRAPCPTDRKSRAARLTTEFVLWQASGGDCLLSSLAAEFIQLSRQA
jgi:hypothetical protein